MTHYEAHGRALTMMNLCKSHPSATGTEESDGAAEPRDTDFLVELTDTVFLNRFFSDQKRSLCISKNIRFFPKGAFFVKTIFMAQKRLFCVEKYTFV